MVDIRWYGHACFKITASGGTVIVTDPFDGKDIGYPTPETDADVALVSHEHYDHNNVKVLGGSPSVIRGVGEHSAKGIVFKGTATGHDESGGAFRGSNTVFTFVVDSVKICHLGDLGHTLSDAQKGDIAPVDVLLIPVGGVFTIDADGADAVVGQLNPKVVIPMHYKTPVLTIPVAPVDPFLKGKSNVKQHGKNTYSVNKDSLPSEQEVVVLDYK